MAAAGQLIGGRYRIVRPLAAGGLGRVWLATDERRGDPVAIKKCAQPDGLNAQEQELLRQWTLREAPALTMVEHPNVVRTLAVVPDAGEPWLIMEYVPSRSLQQVIDESGPLPPARVASIGLAVLAGLEAAGRAGVLHLDVKPGNVLIADDGRVVLADFGPAVTGEGIDALAGAGIILGSPRYIAPERLFDGVASARADLWSLGATLYHAVEGRPPFLRRTTEAILRAVADGTPDRPRRAGPLTPVLEGLLRRDPAARLTAMQAAEQLRHIAEPPGAVSPAPTTRHRPTIRRRAALAAGVCVTAVLTAAAVSTPRSGTPSATPSTVPLIAPLRTAIVLPRGYVWWTDPTGFRVAVPSGWKRTRDGGALLFTSPRGHPSLRISTWSPQPRNVVVALVAQEREIGLPAYRRLKMEPVPESADAVWEFTYHDRTGAPMRDLTRVLVGDGRTYVIEWRAGTAQWAAELQSLSIVLDTFEPAD